MHNKQTTLPLFDILLLLQEEKYMRKRPNVLMSQIHI